MAEVGEAWRRPARSGQCGRSRGGGASTRATAAHFAAVARRRLATAGPKRRQHGAPSPAGAGAKEALKLAAGGLRGLTLRGPELAYAIFARQKQVENRSWPVPPCIKNMGGWLALHVGARKLTGDIQKHLVKAWDRERARGSRYVRQDLGLRDYAWPPRSAIVGLIRISGAHRLARGERRDNPWALGPFCWEIDRAVRLDPPITDVPGHLGLWSVDSEPCIDAKSRRRLYSCLCRAWGRKRGRKRSGPVTSNGGGHCTASPASAAKRPRR